MAYEESYSKFSTDNLFTGVLELDGTIYTASTRNNRRKIGIDSQREEELLRQINEQEEIIKNYYDKLVEIGIITPPKTSEEIAAEQLRLAQEQAEQQALINQSLLEAISGLQSQIKEMTNNGDVRSSSEFSGNTDGQNIKDTGKISTGNKRGDISGKKSAAGNTE